jgi:hypothetical protein
MVCQGKTQKDSIFLVRVKTTIGKMLGGCYAYKERNQEPKTEPVYVGVCL